eukprot:6792602-Prymnesium_polylepis.1
MPGRRKWRSRARSITAEHGFNTKGKLGAKSPIDPKLMFLGDTSRCNRNHGRHGWISLRLALYTVPVETSEPSSRYSTADGNAERLYLCLAAYVDRSIN